VGTKSVAASGQEETGPVEVNLVENGAAGYRMPTVFGPSPGPRYKADGTAWTREEVSASVHRVWVSFKTSRESLERLLPTGLSLDRPVVTVAATYLKNLWWLAGRGYNFLSVSIPVTTLPPFEDMMGDFIAVLWENLGDPIITGREELGFPKLWAEIPDLERDSDSALASASWCGFSFAQVQIRGLVEQSRPNAAERPHIVAKYVPRTGNPGAADASYLVTSASPNGTPEPAADPKVTTRSWAGTGEVSFNTATFTELPTLFPIVNTLAALEIDTVEAAGLSETEGADIRGADMRPLEARS